VSSITFFLAWILVAGHRLHLSCHARSLLLTDQHFGIHTVRDGEQKGKVLKSCDSVRNDAAHGLCSCVPSFAWLLRFGRAGEVRPHAQPRFSITGPPLRTQKNISNQRLSDLKHSLGHQFSKDTIWRDKAALFRWIELCYREGDEKSVKG